jgi:cytochrome c-type biogenesis protein
MILFILSLIAGILTVLAPCVLPLLPVIVGGSLTSEEVNRKKAVVVTLSLGISVIIFTFVLKVGAFFAGIPEYVWQWISGGIIIFFGLITLFPMLWEKISFTSILNRKSNQVLGKGFQKQSLLGDIIIGASLGPVFATCSPTYFIILATVLPASFILGLSYLFAYTFGLCLTLLFVALIGQRIISKIMPATEQKSRFKKVLGFLFILVGVSIIFGFDKKIEAKILNMGFFDITKVEQRLLEINK